MAPSSSEMGGSHLGVGVSWGNILKERHQYYFKQKSLSFFKNKKTTRIITNIWIPFVKSAEFIMIF